MIWNFKFSSTSSDTRFWGQPTLVLSTSIDPRNSNLMGDHMTSLDLQYLTQFHIVLNTKRQMSMVANCCAISSGCMLSTGEGWRSLEGWQKVSKYV